MTTTPTEPTTTFVSTGTTPVCILSEWTTWSNCTPECLPDRYQQRTRSDMNSTCSDRLLESRLCDKLLCEICTITSDRYTTELEEKPRSDGKFSLSCLPIVSLCSS